MKQKKKQVAIYVTGFILLLTLLIRYGKYFELRELPKWTLTAAFLIKIIVGLLFNYVHEITYGGGELSHDGGTFILEGKYLHDLIYTHPLVYLKLLTGIGETTYLSTHYLPITEYWSAGDLTLINDSKNIIRLHSLIHFFSFGSVTIHIAVMNFLSLIGFRYLFLSFRSFSHLSPILFFWILFFVPSTLFWTSSVLKEPVLLLGIGTFLYGLLMQEALLKKLFFLIVGILLLTGIKPYVLALMIPAITIYLLYRTIFKNKIWLTLLISVIGFVTIPLLFPTSKTRVVHYLTRKQFDFVNIGKGGIHAYADTCIYYFQPDQVRFLTIANNKAKLIQTTDAYRIRFGSTTSPVPVHLTPNGQTWTIIYNAPSCSSFVETTPIRESYTQLLKNIPEALINSMIRPFPTDPGSNLKFISVAETWLLLLFFIISIIFHRKLNQKVRGIILSLGIFAFLLYLLIGWTTPVLGAIVRYRFPAQLACVIMSLIWIKPFKIKKWRIMFLSQEQLPE